MIELIEEAINTEEYIKIVSEKDKTFIIKPLRYNNIKLYYYFKENGNNGEIYLDNIKCIEFENKTKQKDFLNKQLGLPKSIDEYFKYYKECLEETEKESENEKNDKKIKLFDTIFNSLYTEDKNNLLIKYLKGEKQEKISKRITPYLLAQSNISQRTAIENAYNNDISIIQGPPGTGKTTTILSLICNFIMDGKKVVVVSKNNSAVENIIDDFKEAKLPEFYLRFGRKEIMEELLENINDKLYNLDNNLKSIKEINEAKEKLENLREKLYNLEIQIDELVELKSVVNELKNQKKFFDRKMKVYNYQEILTDEELTIICEKHANVKTINRLIKIVQKKKYNFFEKLLLKYIYSIKEENIKQKLNSLINLLKEFYLNKEIAQKEEKLMKGDLEGKQKIVKEIYKEYIDLCTKSFKTYLKNNIKIPSSEIKNKQELISLGINNFPLILTTADGFLFNFENMMKLNQKVDCVIIDEASQCDILTGLPLLYLAKRLVVVGDSKQLRAITNANIKTNIPEEYRYNDNSFLESIKNVFNPIEQTLQEHYRCDYNIINFCNKYYYNNELKIYSSCREEAMSIINADKYKGAEKNKNGEIINEREVKTIKENIKSMDKTFIITPYKGQANLIKSEYKEYKKSIGTIHTFQGKGEDKVYFSTVLNNLDFCNKHIKGKYNMFSSELVNVAVSRAKKEFVLVTDINYFKNNKTYVRDISNLIDYINIYGKEINDDSNCIFDYLYKNIKNYKSNAIFDNEYEQVLYKSLNQILEDSNYKCYMKIPLDDLVYNEKFLNDNPLIKRYILNGAHADFTIFDKRINKPILVIELDGKDHLKEEQKIKDEYKNKALLSSNINIWRIPSKKAYDLNDLKENLYSKL